MDEEKNERIDLLENLEPVDPEEIADFQRAMEEVIPKIAQAVEERRNLAAESRRRGKY
ncbi:MAG TPA: hypothetical protein VMX38_11385 [Verrucomicrobiae bacterium]|nr:hypothetical protein [Verrucomicrobiae bacterium]